MSQLRCLFALSVALGIFSCSLFAETGHAVSAGQSCSCNGGDKKVAPAETKKIPQSPVKKPVDRSGPLTEKKFNCICCLSVQTVTCEPASQPQKITDLSTGGFSRPATPGQRISIVAWGFDKDKDAVWVADRRVKADLVSNADEAGTISFVVPDSLYGQIGRRVDVRIGDATKGVPEEKGATLLLRGLQWWQWRSCSNLLVLTTVIALGYALVRLSQIGRPSKSSSNPPVASDVHSRWIVDAQTKSYSLQRIQFLLWTASGVTAYLYSFYALWIVQGLHKFPDLPNTVVGLLGISAGTSLLASAVRSVKGPEGAGASEPALWRDLISTGDVVALDKVQLVVWTLIGVGSFLFSVLSQQPLYLTEKMQDLPAALWQLAGLSGAVFVAGKAVRDPGPVISAVTAQSGATPGTVTFELRGTNLSQDAAFFLGDERISIDRIRGTSGVPEAPNGPAKSTLPSVTVAGDTSAARMVRGLRFDVADADRIPKQSTFSIENLDGQRAECPYTLKEDVST